MAGLRLLACLAHPDDEAFPVGGLLAHNVAEGRLVRLVTTTLGEEVFWNRYGINFSINYFYEQKPVVFNNKGNSAFLIWFFYFKYWLS